MGWSALRGLRVSWRTVRSYRRALGDPERMHRDLDERVGFVEGAGLWVTALAVVVGIVLSLQLIGAGAATGGALLPLSGWLGELWSNALAGQRDALGEVIGPADTLTVLLALLGMATPWQPSTSVVLLLLLAPAIASVSGFFAARRMTLSRWAPAVAAAVWALSPALLSAVTEGRIGAVLAHLALPLAVTGLLRAHVSWRHAGSAAIPLAIAVGGAPVLLPAMALLLLLATAIGWRSPLRPLAAMLPAAALVAPIVIERWIKGSPLAALVDPGVPLPGEPPSAIEAALLGPDGTLAALETATAAMLPDADARWFALWLLVPLALSALAGVVLRPQRAWPWVLLLLAGYGTAVLASRLALTTIDGEPVAIWAGTGASLMLLSLMALALIAADVDGRAGAVPGGLVALAAITAALPIIVSSFLLPSTVVPAPERRMPAFVDAAAATDPRIGTLVLRPLAEDVLSVGVERGRGDTLDDVATGELVRQSAGEQESELAQAAVDLASGGNVDVSSLLDRHGVRFVLLEPERGGAAGLHDRAQRSLDARGELQAIGQTEVGLLWQRPGAAGAEREAIPAWAGWLLAAQLLALAAAAFAALPSLRRGARARTKRLQGTEAWR